MIDKINFFCLGAQKAGTTSLHDILKTHPDIYLPPDKEAHFFDVNERYEKGLDYYYNKYYSSYNNEKIVGNINPNLQVDERSIHRIKDCYGDKVKFILILRKPIERSYSHYLMSKKRGFEDLSFEEALRKENDRIENPSTYKNYYTKELGHFEKNHFGYVLRSQYSKTIKTLNTLFPSENIKIIQFEKFIRNKKSTINEILEFLEVDTNVALNFDIKSNKAQKPKSRVLTKFLNTSSFVKEFIKFIYPFKEHRKALKRKVNNANLKELDDSEKRLELNQQLKLTNDYFKEEISTLENMLEYSLSEWKK